MLIAKTTEVDLVVISLRGAVTGQVVENSYGCCEDLLPLER